MADVKKRLPANVAGNFFVDSTCIDCDACRQLAPASFEEVGDYSAVLRQPETDAQIHQATRHCWPARSVRSAPSGATRPRYGGARQLSHPHGRRRLLLRLQFREIIRGE